MSAVRWRLHWAAWAESAVAVCNSVIQPLRPPIRRICLRIMPAILSARCNLLITSERLRQPPPAALLRLRPLRRRTVTPPLQVHMLKQVSFRPVYRFHCKFPVIKDQISPPITGIDYNNQENYPSSTSQSVLAGWTHQNAKKWILEIKMKKN